MEILFFPNKIKIGISFLIFRMEKTPFRKDATSAKNSYIRIRMRNFIDTLSTSNSF